jgi:hypothetical protein
VVDAPWRVRSPEAPVIHSPLLLISPWQQPALVLTGWWAQ